MQSSCSEVAPICCCACTCKISSKNFSLSPYKICIVTIIVMVINRDGAALARYVAPLKYFFPSISKYFKMISKVLYYKFLLAVAKVSGIIIFILTVGIKENCSFAVQCLLSPKPTSQKWLVVGCCIYGTFGELIPKPDPNKRECVHKHLIGNVLHAVGHGKYMVAFGNGETIECCSNCLRIERTTSSIPPDAPPQQAIKRPTNAPP